MLAKNIFQHLWNHHQHKDIDNKKAHSAARSIVGTLTSPGNADEYYFSLKGRKEAEMIMEDLIANVDGMENLPYPWPLTREEKRNRKTFRDLLKSGDPELVGDFLVPYKGWAKKYEALEEEQGRAPRRAVVHLPKLPPGYPSGPACVMVPSVDEDGNIVMVRQKVGTLVGEDDERQSPTE